MARSDVLVSTDWAESNLDAPNTVFVEVDEDTSAYEDGHIAGAVRLDWKTELQDQVKRDFVDQQQFSKLLSDKGISNDDTVILYGGNNNWFAAYAYWYFKVEALRTMVAQRTQAGVISNPTLRGQLESIALSHKYHLTLHWEHTCEDPRRFPNGFWQKS